LILVVIVWAHVFVKLCRFLLNCRLMALELRLTLAHRFVLSGQLLTLFDELVDNDSATLSRLGHLSLRASWGWL
jgi:hypothetical protein